MNVETIFFLLACCKVKPTVFVYGSRNFLANNFGYGIPIQARFGIPIHSSRNFLANITLLWLRHSDSQVGWTNQKLIFKI